MVRHKAVYCVGVDRAFSEEELDRFLSAVDDQRLRFAYELMARLGLRRSEVVRINKSDILLDVVKPIIRVHNLKNKRIDTLKLHPSTATLIENYLREYQDEINNHEGYLIWSDNYARTCNYMSAAFISRQFRYYARAAGLDDAYVEIPNAPGQMGNSPTRKLRRLATHSLRRYYITKFARKGINPYIIQRLARHKQFSSTEIYINLNDKDEEDAMNKAWGGTSIDADDFKNSEEFGEFLKMWKAWKQLQGSQ